MTNLPYIARSLNLGEHHSLTGQSASVINQSDLFDQAWKVLVLLTEPGAGKSRFAANIGRLDRCRCVLAWTGKHIILGEATRSCDCLIIDGLDEILDQTKIEEVITRVWTQLHQHLMAKI